MAEVEKSQLSRPEIRFLVAYPHSGSTLIVRTFAESSVCALTGRLMLMGNARKEDGFTPECSTFESPSKHKVFHAAMALGKQFLICKEELRNDTTGVECRYRAFPSSSTYRQHRPIKPVFFWFETWCESSTAERGWVGQMYESLIDCFTNVIQMPNQADSTLASWLLYKQLIREPQKEIQGIWARWGVPFSDDMLKFKQLFASSFLFATERERKIYSDNKRLGLFSSVEAYSSIVADIPGYGLLFNDEKDYIEESVGLLYLGCWQDKLFQLRAVLVEKSRIRFALDNALQSPVRPPKRLSRSPKNTARPSLSRAEEAVFGDPSAEVFQRLSDGRTSHEYRKERSSAVMAHFALPLDDSFLNELPRVYEITLMESLLLKCGALDLLSLLKALG